MTADILRLLVFWAMVAVLFGFMIIMVWWFKIGDVHMLRRTVIYFVSVFIVLPGLTLLLFTYSESMAKPLLLLGVILGTVIYLAFTVIAIIRPKP